ncbi:DUF6460 domain-containing protein [Acuticoccus sp. I52.16.1]|uniref:DUF6460 domain-containing protein n=1 Tax=Acuticoccus sp. I52.16.1 TaxID=2928472 RepID=UPI001FD27229|nr:DUF6460 domain-containing protein [Acuticoccus sp. I52.16.1]UOM33376.1 DUF6460 domain-containing protein [Acuticoccus sp. I52.16.1]
MSSLERRYGATERVLGGSPMGVLIRLVVMSFVVGLILTMLDINPNDIINWFDQRFRALTNLGFESIAQFFNVMVVGAVIVVPIWLFARVIKILSK